MGDSLKALPFHREMARAIILCRKKMTRRPIKLDELQRSTAREYDFDYRDKRGRWNSVPKGMLLEKCPYGQVGDRVRLLTQWATEVKYDKVAPSKLPKDAMIWSWFHSEEKPVWCGRLRHARFMPNRFREENMPVAQITSLDVQSLMEISEEDACAEGVWPKHGSTGFMSYVEGFFDVWKGIYGELPDKEQFVFVIGFSFNLQRWVGSDAIGRWLKSDVFKCFEGVK